MSGYYYSESSGYPPQSNDRPSSNIQSYSPPNDQRQTPHSSYDSRGIQHGGNGFAQPDRGPPRDYRDRSDYPGHSPRSYSEPARQSSNHSGHRPTDTGHHQYPPQADHHDPPYGTSSTQVPNSSYHQQSYGDDDEEFDPQSMMVCSRAQARQVDLLRSRSESAQDRRDWAARDYKQVYCDPTLPPIRDNNDEPEEPLPGRTSYGGKLGPEYADYRYYQRHSRSSQREQQKSDRHKRWYP